ncbi:MAG TPA: universal stress protein [Micrococcales bacterium]|uniref:universal stress protein n=1 Tax=Miniimonas arenae TaxID=676201 RepID=UPI000ED8EAD4|nr:universal stress protein [Miniimonas arenae]HCX83996.1 universal stress protein [Micrococcales bacterium]
MSVLVGCAPERSGRHALALAAGLARARGEEVELVHAVVRSWPATPGAGDGEFRQWARESADETTRRGLEELALLAPDVVARTHTVEARSTVAALHEAIEALHPSALVLGSGAHGALGQVTLGSTANALAHSSPVPVLVAPRGHRTVTLDRVVAAWSPADPPELLAEMAEFAREAGLRVRAVTFGRAPHGMYPPEVGLDVEDEVFEAWQTQAREALEAAARAAGLDEGDASLALGEDWLDAVDAVDWEPGDLLAVGSHGGGVLRRVFLGSTAAKILRHAPVPVVLFPG